MSNYKGWKGKAWKAFSNYIRMRDCLKTTGTKDYCICATCGRRETYLRTQAGHSIAGRYNSILLHPEITNGQCCGCNMTGNYAKYSIFMIKTYGLEKWEEFVALSRQVITIKEWQWKEETYKYQAKLKELSQLPGAE